MAAKDEKVVVKVEDYGGSDVRKWEVAVGRELFGQRNWVSIVPRFKSEARAYHVAASLAADYVADGRVVIIITRAGKERTVGT